MGAIDSLKQKLVCHVNHLCGETSGMFEKKYKDHR